MPAKCVENDQSPVHRNRGTSRIGLAGSAVVVVMALTVIGGCQKTALRPNDSRSQFDQYDQARNQRAQPFLEDEFGRRTPNLSERLLDRSD